MEIGLASELFIDLLNKSSFITDLSNKMKRYFRDKDYGSGIKSIYIGIISVPPEGERFHPLRKKFTKSRKNLEYDIRVDYEKFRSAENSEIFNLLSDNILNSLNIIDEIRIPDFNKDIFFNDLEICMKEITGSHD